MGSFNILDDPSLVKCIGILPNDNVLVINIPTFIDIKCETSFTYELVFLELELLPPSFFVGSLENEVGSSKVVVSVLLHGHTQLSISHRLNCFSFVAECPKLGGLVVLVGNVNVVSTSS